MVKASRPGDNGKSSLTVPKASVLVGRDIAAGTNLY
jgi:hypothetical protein